MRTLSRPAAACAAALLALGLVACGSSTATSPGTAATAPVESAIATAPPADDATDGATADEDDPDDSGDDSSETPEANEDKVSANTASEDEIAQALTTAGVSNPGRWAEEVVEYRPYPADDPDLTKLRQNLAKYNPGQETTDKIVSALTP